MDTVAAQGLPFSAHGSGCTVPVTSLFIRFNQVMIGGV